VLQVRQEQEPIPRPGELRLRVEAAGVSVADLLARRGRHPLQPPYPYAPGHEVAGIVDAVAPGAGPFHEGDPVLALAAGGGYGAAVCVPHERVWRRPPDMPARHGAALPVDYLSAYLMLVTMGSARAGARVLIHDASSSLGLALVDICGVLGADVVATAPDARHAFLQSRGVQHAVDAGRHDYVLALRELLDRPQLDLVVDTQGGRRWRQDFRLLAPTGRALFAAHASLRTKRVGNALQRLFSLPRYDPLALAAVGRGVLGFSLFAVWEETSRLRAAMDDLLDWYRRGWLPVHVAAELPLAEAAEAHRKLEADPDEGKRLLIP
jgi:NADPH:quinone reductase-like Zn-dependent oxidoreductase